ncbi:MAG: ATP-binding protein, partial [Paraclostridium sp.]
KTLINYIDNIEIGLKKYNNTKVYFNTGNMIVDSILKNKKLICEENNILLDVDVDFSKSNNIEMIDVCIIFSNIIDNAIEACIKINSDKIAKKIILKSKYIDKFCVIVIENNKTNKVRVKNNKFITSKNNSFLHGIGLKNIKKTVKKYSGEMIIENYESRFILKIMIPSN